MGTCARFKHFYVFNDSGDENMPRVLAAYTGRSGAHCGTPRMVSDALRLFPSKGRKWSAAGPHPTTGPRLAADLLTRLPRVSGSSSRSSITVSVGEGPRQRPGAQWARRPRYRTGHGHHRLCCPPQQGNASEGRTTRTLARPPAEPVGYMASPGAVSARRSSWVSE